ncbi:hypothetical protein WJX84_003042 [Apatococcus fuscideae]|uniref:Endonuclease n=1 Tax=Apatococcus fuscideae TaxID=2026836 RepID=A0AAW1TF11_9CHLO
MILRVPMAAFGGVLAGALGCYVYLQHGRLLPNDLAPSSLHAALKHGAPTTNQLLFSQNFVASFNSRLRNPDWVLEVIREDTCYGAGTRESVEFFEDPALPERFRNRLSDFKGSAYDRGHLAPAANHRGNQQSLVETFSLANISPQVGKGFNRDFWARFERFVRGLSKTCSEVRVLTGPLYLPMKTPTGYILAHPMLGEMPRLVGVPTRFFKVIVAEPKGEDMQPVVGAFVMPNAAIDPRTPLTLFSVPISALEEAAGFEVFPAFLSSARRTALDSAARFWQYAGVRESHAVASKDQPILEPALLVPTHSYQPLQGLVGQAGAVLPSTLPHDTLSPSRSMPPEVNKDSDSSSLATDAVQTSPSLSEPGPAGSLQGLPDKSSSPKPKRRLKRSQSSPVSAGQQLQQSQLDTGMLQAAGAQLCDS